MAKIFISYRREDSGFAVDQLHQALHPYDDALGCTNLGFLYRNGYGVTQDYGRAQQLFQHGSDGGSAGGYNNLERLGDKGR